MGLIHLPPRFQSAVPCGVAGHIIIGDFRSPCIASVEEAYESLAFASRTHLLDGAGFRAVQLTLEPTSMAERADEALRKARIAAAILNIEGVSRIYADGVINVVCKAGAETMVRIALGRLRERLPSDREVLQFVEEGNFVPFVENPLEGRQFVF